MKTIDNNNTKCYNIVGDVMSIEIRCTPYAQSAEVQIEIDSSYDPTYSDLYIIIEIGERGYLNDYTKQRMTYGGIIDKDGTFDVTSTFSFIAYPLHSASEYEITAWYIQRGSDGQQEIQTFEKNHLNFSTWTVQTSGKLSDRVPELSEADRKINATYLHRHLVRSGKMSLESFCALLGLADCAGNLNPAANICFGSFDGENSATDYYPNYQYNFTDAYIVFYEGEYPDYIWHNANIILGDSQRKISQNGITVIRNDQYYSKYGSSIEPWYYNHCDDLYSGYSGYTPTYGEYYKFAKSFTILPFYHADYIRHLYIALTGRTDNNTLDLFRRNTWLNIETTGLLIDRLLTLNTVPWWQNGNPDYNTMYAKYNTLGKFAKCRDKNIDKLAEFVFECFKGGVYGSLAYNTTLYFQQQRIVKQLYNLDCIKKKANFWYNYFKKDRPWWPYFRWTI